MPFKSDAHRRYMYSQHPDVAKKWRKKYGPQEGLPERVGKKMKKMMKEKKHEGSKK